MNAGPPGADAFRAGLQRVLDGESFRNSDALRRLLAYLGEKTLLGEAEDLKEYTIGVEACGKPSSYDPQRDASVRVQISRLRQKLEEYHRTEGRADPIVIELPRGHFKLLFRANGSATAVSSPKRARLWLAALTRWVGWKAAATAALLLLLLGWAAYLSVRVGSLEKQLVQARSASHEPETAALWSRFFAPDSSAVVVFGSPVFFANDAHSFFIRFYRLREGVDRRQDPGFTAVESKLGTLAGPRHDYAQMGDVMAVGRLTAFFGRSGHVLKSVPAHLAAWDTLQEGNLIFLGAERMNPLLRRLPIEQDFGLGPDSNIHNRKPGPGEQAVYTTPSHRDTLTYALVARYAGLRPGREIMLITAHSTPGVVGAVDYITRPESLREIHQRAALAPGQPFQLLLRIFVDNDNPVKTEYVTHHISAPRQP